MEMSKERGKERCKERGKRGVKRIREGQREKEVIVDSLAHIKSGIPQKKTSLGPLGPIRNMRTGRKRGRRVGARISRVCGDGEGNHEYQLGEVEEREELHKCSNVDRLAYIESSMPPLIGHV
jgi:hypothetical protein